MDARAPTIIRQHHHIGHRQLVVVVAILMSVSGLVAGQQTLYLQVIIVICQHHQS